ncbi:MAG: clostripain-related cysteine peptidase [Candidatus Hodarchaeota archaeon]
MNKFNKIRVFIFLLISATPYFLYFLNTNSFVSQFDSLFAQANQGIVSLTETVSPITSRQLLTVLSPDVSPPQAISWVEEPTNQRVKLGELFYYNLNASASAGISNWWLNDTANFHIDNSGVITNNSLLEVSRYGLQVWVNDTLTNVLSANFTVEVLVFKSWSVLVYLDGDNYLEEYAFLHLNEMELVGSTDDVNIIVYVDFKNGSYAPFAEAKCFNITFDDSLDQIGSVELTTDLPQEPNMGDWRTLSEFLNFGQTIAPADNYLLIIYNRGLGIDGCCFEESQNDALYPNELSLAMNTGLIEPLDIIFFDAGRMAQVEIAYELRNFTDFLVVSEEPIPIAGFPYAAFFEELASDPAIMASDLAKRVVVHYVNTFKPGGIHYQANLWELCFSVIRCDRMNAVALALDKFSQSILDTNSHQNCYDNLCLIRGLTGGLQTPDFMDILTFLNLLQTYLEEETVRANASELYNQLSESIVYSERLFNLSSYTGLSIAFRPYGVTELELRDFTQWDEFTSTFLALGETPSTALIVTNRTSLFGYLSDRGDTCFYSLIAPNPTVISIGLATIYGSEGVNFNVALFDANLNLLAFDASGLPIEAVSYRLIAGNTYYIMVKSINGLGAYHLNISFGHLLALNEIIILSGSLIVIFSTGISFYYANRKYHLIRRSKKWWQNRAIKRIWEPGSPNKSAYIKITTLLQEVRSLIANRGSLKQIAENMKRGLQASEQLAKNLLANYQHTFDEPNYNPHIMIHARRAEMLPEIPQLWSTLTRFEFEVLAEPKRAIIYLEKMAKKIDILCEEALGRLDAGETRINRIKSEIQIAVDFAHLLQVDFKTHYEMAY